MSILNTAKKYYVNYRGWSTSRKIVVIESDDWGSIRTKDSGTLNLYRKQGVDFESNLFINYDTLESRKDLERLFQVLRQYKDMNGNHPVITANALVANPDFKKIKDSNFSEYFFEEIPKTYKRVFPYDDVFDYWKSEGIINNKLLWPQFHGREHLNYQWWMDELKEGNKSELLAFEEESILGIINKTPPRSMNGYMAAFDSDLDVDNERFKMVIEEGTAIFKRLFGFQSKSFVAPCAIRSNQLNNTLVDNGLIFHQMGQQVTPLNEGYKLINRFWGDTNEVNQLFWRRNSVFEPYKGFKNRNYRHEVLGDAKVAFRCGKPLVINTHRLNFVSGIEAELPNYTFELLSAILKELLNSYPDIEFMTSDELGSLINK